MTEERGDGIVYDIILEVKTILEIINQHTSQYKSKISTKIKVNGDEANIDS